MKNILNILTNTKKLKKPTKEKNPKSNLFQLPIEG